MCVCVWGRQREGEHLCVCMFTKPQEIPGQTCWLSSTSGPCDWKHTGQIVCMFAWGGRDKNIGLERNIKAGLGIWIWPSTRGTVRFVAAYLPLNFCFWAISHPDNLRDDSRVRVPVAIQCSQPPLALCSHYISIMQMRLESVTLLLLSTIYSAYTQVLRELQCLTAFLWLHASNILIHQCICLYKER